MQKKIAIVNNLGNIREATKKVILFLVAQPLRGGGGKGQANKKKKYKTIFD